MFRKSCNKFFFFWILAYSKMFAHISLILLMALFGTNAEGSEGNPHFQVSFIYSCVFSN